MCKIYQLSYQKIPRKFVSHYRSENSAFWYPPYLGITIIFKLMSDESVKGIPAVVKEVAPDWPQVTEDEDGADEGMELGGVLAEVGTPLL